MNNKNLFFSVMAALVLAQVSCSGGGSGASSGVNGTTAAGGTNSTSGGQDTTPSDVAAADEETADSVELTAVYLDAFRDFSCTSGWTTRRGGLGRAPYAGSGSCSAAFTGESGTYSVALKAQLEFDGSSPYRISINGNTIDSGNYPYSQGELICDCPNHEQNCPDKVIDIGAGRHQINTGDTIEFWGDDVYPCGDDSHGSYAIWRGISFTP